MLYSIIYALTTKERWVGFFVRFGTCWSTVATWSQLIAPGDITIYTTLCALATFQRSSIKGRLLENATFSLYIEQEPYIRELVQAYLNSNFKVVLELLSRYSVCFLLLFDRTVSVLINFETDTTLRRHPPCTTCAELDQLDPELGCGAVLPALRYHQAG